MPGGSSGSIASTAWVTTSKQWKAKERAMARKTETKANAAMQELPPLRLSRTLHAPRATVFKAWTSAEHVKRWFCPETFTIPIAEVETRVGGAFNVCMRSPTGEAHWIRGTFV